MAIEDNKHGQANPGVTFEISDLSARGILGFFIVLAIVAVAVHFVVYGFYQALEGAAAKRDPEASPLAKQVERPQAAVLQNTPSPALEEIPEPHLETNEPLDVRSFREREEATLNGQPWRDPAGAVHLPIEQAMKALARRGLPARTTAAPTTNYPGVGREYSGIRELERMESAEPQPAPVEPESKAATGGGAR